MKFRNVLNSLAIFVSLCTVCYSQKETDYSGMWRPDICPVLCACKMEKYESPSHGRWMRVINCSTAGLTSVPRNISDKADALVLRFNRIRSLKIRDSLKYLKYLDVSSNQITQIDNKLQKLTHLKSLDLHNNSISHLQNGQFSGLKYLASLDLSDNSLHSIEKHTFGGLNYVQSLHLDGNKISYLEKQWFFSMPSLSWLYLSRNSIRRIPPNMFETLSKLAMIKLDYNQIHELDASSFQGLSQMTALDLSFNKLTVVPTSSIQSLSRLQYVYVDGNPIYRIDTSAFHSLNISFITVSYMPKLTVVEGHSFVNLPRLLTLQLHDNAMLRFVDPHAFSEVPNLRNLYLHNDALLSISETIRNSLPSMDNCHFYNNAMRCDCNSYWIKQELVKEKEGNYTSVMYDDSVLTCESPPNLTGRLLKALPAKYLNQSCAPITLPLFDAQYNLSVGEELRLECHSLGVPEATIQWHLPNDTVVQGSVKYGRLQVIDNSTFIIRHLGSADSGIYTCRASNSQGADTSSTSVNVNNKPIRVIPAGVSADYVTITWNGTTYRSVISDYQIHYRCPSSSTAAVYTVIHLGPHSTRYTITSLQPLTMYEFCIVYVYETEQYYVDCVNVTTTNAREMRTGITRIDKRIVLGICVFLVVGVAIGCIITVIKKFRREKIYLEHSCDEKTDIMSQIPLDNFYNPTHSHIMCSSRTSLITLED